jgi:hypothetical protein
MSIPFPSQFPRAAVLLAMAPLLLSPIATLRAQNAGLQVSAEAVPSLTVLPSDEKVAATANVLKDTLRQMTGVELADAPSWTGKGILVSLTSALPGSERELSSLLKDKPPEAYGYDINGDRAVIAGNSPKALSDGVYALLEQLGCRWLVPSKRWTVIPKVTGVVLPAQKTVSVPDFFYRAIWYAYGSGNRGEEISRELEEAYKTWCDANRLGGVTKYKIGHTYASTVSRHEADFRAHPEYFAMDENGNRLPFGHHQSLCYSNPEVARFFIEDKLAELRADRQENPDSYVVSMDPNDGSKACFCEECKKLGSGTDQALHLANQVARELRKEIPNAVVTMYAYASHRLPPEKIKAEPNVEIQVAMGFNKTQYTLEQLVALWMEKVSSVGIRDYFGVMAWDWGLPGRGKASNYGYVSEYLPKYHAWGARAFNTEINANWASFGPASYLATKLLWDVKSNPEAIYDDFFRSGFGKAAPEVKQLYRLFSRSPNLTRHNINSWLTQLDKAFQAAKGEDGGVQRRLIDLAAFLHYAILYRKWELAVDSNDQEKMYEALKPLLEFTWRIRDRNMVHAYALQRRLVNSGHEKIRPLREGWKFNDPAAVWKHPDILTDEELLAIFRKDLQENPPDTRIVDFDSTLAPLGEASRPEELTGGLRYQTEWHVLVEKDEHLEFKLPMSGVKANYRLEIFNQEGEPVWESEASVTQTESRYEQKPFEMDVKFPAKGRYRLVFHAGEDYVPKFPEGLKVVLDVGPEKYPLLRMFGPTYFYVPKGTENILVTTDGRFSVVPPGATARTDYTGADNDPKLECIVIPVNGQDGEVWTLHASTSGRVGLFNIPPYLATEPGRLLVPTGLKK